MTKFDEQKTKGIHEDIPRAATNLFPGGLYVNQTLKNCFLTPVNFHTSKDNSITFKLKSGTKLSHVDLQYLWARIVFRTCQAYHNFVDHPPDTCHTKCDYQHLFALAFMCIGYYFNTSTQQKRHIIKSILYFIDDQLYNLGIPGFSGIMYLDDTNKIMVLFDKFYNLCARYYNDTPDAIDKPIDKIEP